MPLCPFNSAEFFTGVQRVRLLIWIAALTTLLGPATSGRTQPYGLTSRPELGAFINNHFPKRAPGIVAGGYSTVEAFPNLTFDDPVALVPRRWVVERTFGWLGRYRRLHRDYERQAHTGETMIYVAMIRLMLARLARPQ